MIGSINASNTMSGMCTPTALVLMPLQCAFVQKQNGHTCDFLNSSTMWATRMWRSELFAYFSSVLPLR